MRTTLSLLFFLRKPKNYQSWPMPIYLHITVEGEQREISIKRQWIQPNEIKKQEARRRLTKKR